MRRKDRKLNESESYEILEKGEYGILSLVNIDGRPYSIPLNYCMKENAVYFHSAVEGTKIDLINKNPAASFCVVGDTKLLSKRFSTLYESVVVEGSVSEVFEEEKQMSLEGLISKYSKDFIGEGMEYIEKAFKAVRVFKLSVESISGKKNRG